MCYIVHEHYTYNKAGTIDTMQMLDDEIKCYGHYSRAGKCASCEYLASCQMYTQTEGRMEKPLGGQDYDAAAPFAEDMADLSNIPGNDTEEETSRREEAFAPDLAAFFSFILHLDNYTLGILAEIISPSKAGTRLSCAEISRIHGISRQGMHRKLIDTVRKSPELSSLLACVLMKVRKARSDFRAAENHTASESAQMEFPFDV